MRLRNNIPAKQKSTFLFLVISLLLVIGTPAQAGLLSYCTRALTQLALPYAVEYHKGKTVRPKDSNDPTLIVLGDRIGLGNRGGLYQVAKASIIPGVIPTTLGLVAKIPHSLRLPSNSGPNPEAELEMRREIFTYELLKSQWDKVEKDSRFPKNPSWEKGTIPAAPILKEFESKMGTLLIKPEIQGDSLKKLYAQYQGKLPSEMQRSINEIYSLVDAISNQVKTPLLDSKEQWTSGRPFYTDINPENLVWVSNPAEMKLLRLKTPSFAFYEITPLINRMPQFLPLRENR